MVNPFKPGDKVVAMRKGVEITATVRNTWNHEVQIFSDTRELLWRTMKTIRMTEGESEPVAETPSEEQMTPEETHLPQEPSPAQPKTAEAESAVPIHVSEAPQEGSSAGDEAASTEETPKVAPEEHATILPRARERRKGSHGEKSRSKRSRK